MSPEPLPPPQLRGKHRLLGKPVLLRYSDPWVRAEGWDFEGEERETWNETLGWLIEWAGDICRLASERTPEGWRWVTTVPRPAIRALLPASLAPRPLARAPKPMRP